MRRSWWMVLPIVLLMGCQMSMNLQRSSLRGSGDLGTTAVLDNEDDDSVDITAAQIKKYAEDLLAFVTDGDLSLVTKGELRVKLLKVVPNDYAGIVSDLLGIVNVVNVDTDFIGRGNVKRIKAFLVGVVNGVDEYRKEDRD